MNFSIIIKACIVVDSFLSSISCHICCVFETAAWRFKAHVLHEVLVDCDFIVN